MDYILTKLKLRKKPKKEAYATEPGEEEDEDEKRETWSGKCDFFLSTLGYAVGLGAVWRFPYLCYKNGGGVFLIPYFIFLFLVGIPLVFLELCIGQFTSSGPLTCWTMSPIFRGVGISMNIVNTYLTIYYNMIIAYSLYFLILSLTSLLPWQTCDKSKWSSENCLDNYTNFTFTYCNMSNSTIKCPNGRCYNTTILTSNLKPDILCNNTANLNEIGWWNPVYPSQDYWNNVVLRKSSGVDDTGDMIWQLVVALLVGWIIVFAMVVKGEFIAIVGIHVSGKLVYFTSLFPYVVLLILGIRGWILPGAEIGIKFYIFPDFSRLQDIRVWSDAANQIFFTLSVSYGGLVALSSYNKFSTNVMRDAIFVSLSNCLTSVFAGFVVFAYIGYLSKETNLSMDRVVQAGQGLAYVVYPYAVTTIPVAPLWAILFFIMMLILGLDTMMASVEIIATSFFDLIPALKKNWKRRSLSIAILCSCLFLLGLTFCSQAGTYWIEIIDSYSGGWAVFLVGAIECISVMWFYGYDNFRTDISVMIGKRITHNKVFLIWRILWSVVTPLLLIALAIFAMIDTKRLKSGNYEYPMWTEIIGNLMTVSTILGVIVWPVYLIIDALCIHKRPIKSLFFKPAETWKPLKKKHQELVRLAYEEKRLKEEERKNKKNGKAAKKTENGVRNEAYQNGELDDITKL